MTVNYQGTDVDFTKVFYPYCIEQEGYKNKVYRDIKGLPTVGIGHLVTTSDNLAVGDVISNDMVEQLFTQDYERLNIEKYVQEIADTGYSYNMCLAVAHFIWGHGYGQYRNSDLRGGLLNKTFDAESIQTYLAANWDRKSKTNRRVNKDDFNIGFDTTPWVPGFSYTIQTGLSSQFPRVADWIKENKTAITIVLFFMLILVAAYFIYKKYGK